MSRPLRGRSPSLASSVGRIPKNASLERFCPAGRNSTSSVQILLTEMKNARESRACVDLAEEVGFEPTEPCGSTVFKTAAFNHSAIPPVRPDYIRCLIDAASSVGLLQVFFGRLRPGGASSCTSRPRVQRPRRRPRLCAPAPSVLPSSCPRPRPRSGRPAPRSLHHCNSKRFNMSVRQILLYAAKVRCIVQNAYMNSRQYL